MVKLTDVTGIGPVTAKLLSERNIKTVAALAAMSLAELQKIPGLSGDIRARAVKQAAADCLQDQAARQPAAAVSRVQATVKKAEVKKTVAGQTVKQAGAAEEKDIAKKKNKKDGKKKEKDKGKKKKAKNKDKNKKKDNKKKGKDKKKS